MRGGLGAVIDHTSQLQAPQFTLDRHYHETLVAIWMYPSEVIENAPIYVLQIRSTQIHGA